ncbi:MAG: PadR family transcriptional regulator [Candidatus Bathyarchaeia archaeon]
MLTRILLLGVLSLNRKPMHGYEIKKNLKNWAVGEFTDVSYGSIYYNLEEMERDGLVESKVVKNSKRPERKLYNITKKGEIEFIALLRKIYFEVENERILFPFDVGVCFMPVLPKKEVMAALDKRIKFIQQMLKEHYSIRNELKGKIPFFALSILDHHLLHFEAEKLWLTNLKKEVEIRFEEFKGGISQ